MQRIRPLILILAATALGSAFTAGSAAARGNVLPDATYEVMIQVDAEFTDLAKVPESELSEKQRLAEERAICRSYSTDDLLQKNLRERCLTYRTTAQLIDRTTTCKTWSGCLRLLKQISASHERSYRLMAEANRIASATVPVGACRTALLFTGNELRYQREYGRLETAYIRAGFDGDKRKMKAIEKRGTKQLNKLKTRSGDERHEQIVAHC